MDAPFTVMPSCRYEWVGPDLATAYLAQSTGNRTESLIHIDGLSREMSADRYYPTSAGIGFDVTKRLIDGHHRLRAIINSGKTVLLLVCRDLPVEAMGVTDLDLRKRRAGDALRLSYGVEDGTSVAAIVRFLATMLTGNTVRLSAREIANVYSLAREHIDWALTLHSEHHSLVGAVPRGCFVMARPTDRARVEQFAKEFMDGTGSVGTPSRVLRDKILADGGITRGGAGDRRNYGRMTLSALWSHLRGDSQRKLFRADDDSARARFAQNAAPWFDGIITTAQ